MALIHGFEYDIFISYAHIDNLLLPGQAKGWIEQFYQSLDVMLARRLGGMDTIKFWWDERRLDGSTNFDLSIQEGIRKAAIMICLNSPGYKRSTFCQQELSLFHEKAKSEKPGLEVAHRSRIFNVLLNNISHKEWPSALIGATGFPFFSIRTTEDFGDPFDPFSNEFRRQMQKLRDAIYNLLCDLQDIQHRESAQSAIQPQVREDIFSVYMAEVSDTLRTSSKRVIHELQKKGFKVVRGIPPPYEANAHEKAVIDAVRNAQLTVHLLDKYPGREIEGAPETCYPQRQVELALKEGKPQMIWIPDETDIENVEEENYKFFLQNLENGKVGGTAYVEFVHSSLSSVTRDIIDIGERLKAKQSQVTTDNRKLPVLLDTHVKDQLHALELSKVLIENHIQPYINPQEDDPRKNINLLESRISQVRKLIFLYGGVSKEWVLERMNVALQLIVNNNYPIEGFFIYMAPPYKASNGLSIRQKFLKINIVNSSNSHVMDNNILQHFLKDLKSDVV